MNNYYHYNYRVPIKISKEVRSMLMGLVLMGHNTCKKCGRKITKHPFYDVDKMLRYEDIKYHMNMYHDDISVMISLMEKV